MNNSKAKFILKNFIKVLLLLFAVSVAAFALMTASPIDPLKANVGQAALGSMSQEQIAKLEEYWGVGQPPGRDHGSRKNPARNKRSKPETGFTFYQNSVGA